MKFQKYSRVSFAKSDRLGNIQLVEIQANADNSRYEFVPFERKLTINSKLSPD